MSKVKDFNVGDVLVRDEPVLGGFGNFIVKVIGKTDYKYYSHYTLLILESDSRHYSEGSTYNMDNPVHYSLYNPQDNELPEMAPETELHTKYEVIRVSGLDDGVWLDMSNKLQAGLSVTTKLDIETALQLAHDLRRYAMQSRRKQAEKQK